MGDKECQHRGVVTAGNSQHRVLNRCCGPGCGELRELPQGALHNYTPHDEAHDYSEKGGPFAVADGSVDKEHDDRWREENEQSEPRGHLQESEPAHSFPVCPVCCCGAFAADVAPYLHQICSVARALPVQRAGSGGLLEKRTPGVVDSQHCRLRDPVRIEPHARTLR